MPKKTKQYTAKELARFPYIGKTLHDMDQEDGSMAMVREWQGGAFHTLPSSTDYEPIEAVDGEIRERITFSIPRFQLLKLKETANSKGIPYQTYLNSIIKQSLDSHILH